MRITTILTMLLCAVWCFFSQPCISQEVKDKEKGITFWLKCMKADEAFARREAAINLSWTKGQNPLVAEAFLKALDDEDSDVVERAMVYLSNNRYDGKNVVPKLISMLEKTNGKTGGSIAVAISLYGAEAKQARPALTKAYYRSLDEDARREIISRLGYLFPRDETLDPLLTDALSDKSAIVRIAAARVHYQVKKTEKEAIKIILVELKNPDAKPRLMAVRCLQELGVNGKEAFKELAPLVRDRDVDVRDGTLETLPKIGARPDEVLKVLATCLKDETVRGTTIYSMSSFGSQAKKYVSDIEKFIDDPEIYIKIASRVGVAKIKGDYSEVIPFLLNKLQDDDSDTKGAAARELGNIGPMAKAALPLLRKMVPTIQGGQNRVWVQEAIKKIEVQPE